MSESSVANNTSNICVKAHLTFENGNYEEIHEDLKHLFQDHMFEDVILEDKEQLFINTTYLKTPTTPKISVDNILSSSSTEYIDEKVEECFPCGSVWDNRDLLRQSLTKTMAKTQCLLSLNHPYQLQCKNCKNRKGCSFHINIVAICKTKKPNKRNRTPLWQHPVTISSACFKHSCSRTSTTFKAAIQRSGIEQKVVDEQLNQLIINLNHTTPSLPTKVLRPILETFCPTSIIWDADKLRDFRTSFFNKVASLSEEDQTNIEKFRENFTSLDYNDVLTSSATFADSTTFNSKVLCKMFLKEYEGGLGHGCSDMNLIDNTVEGYLKFCYSHDDTFDYRIFKDVNGIIVSVAWMTGAMRDAFDRYGTIVFFDGCHKKLNTSLYPYFGILVKDTNHCILPAIEALGIGEEDRVIRFIFKSMIEMAHERKPEDIKVVSSDGILDQSYVNLKLNLPQAYYWADTWHIIERNFGNKKNIPMVLFNKIRNDLWNMAKATSKDKFESYYNAILEEFKTASVSSEVIKYFVDTVRTKQKHFASHYANSVEGLFGFNGTQANEAKHSTFTVYFHDNYCHPPYRLICDLLFLGRVCQGKITKNLNSDNANLLLMKEKSTTSKKPMHAAVTAAIGMKTNESLNYQGFLLWMNEFNAASDKCSVINTSNNGPEMIVVYDSDSQKKYSFESIKARCPGCKVSCAFVMQCRHEICVRLKSKLPPEELFEIARCDKRWYFQEDITILARNNTSLDTRRTNILNNTDLDQNLTGYDILTQTSPTEEDDNTTVFIDNNDTSSLINSVSMKKMKTPRYKRYHLDEIDHNDVERITTQFHKKLSMCGNNNIKKKALSMLLSIIESCDREGMTDDSLDNAWRNYCGDSRQLIPNPNNSDPLPASRSAMNAARYNSNTLTTQENMRKKLKKSDASSQSGLSSRNIISSNLGNACGFCNQRKCSIKTCSMKESYGTTVSNADDFFEKICKEYPIGKTPMKVQFSENDKFFTARQNCHIVVHSIHPRNELLEQTNPPSKKEDLVLQITCLHKKKDKFTTGCGLPIDGFNKVTVPCSLLYSVVVQIVGNKTANRYVFDKVAKDGTGPGFLPRTTHPTSTSTLHNLPYTSNVNHCPQMVLPQPFMMPPVQIYHPWFNTMPPHKDQKKKS